jgi:hypothetical protein
MKSRIPAPFPSAGDGLRELIGDSHSFFVSYPCFDQSAGFPSCQSYLNLFLQIIDDSFIPQRSIDEGVATNGVLKVLWIIILQI